MKPQYNITRQPPERVNFKKIKMKILDNASEKNV